MNQAITLDQLRQMPLGEVAALPVRELARLQQDAAEAMGRVKLVNELLDGVFARRFGDSPVPPPAPRPDSRRAVADSGAGQAP